VLVESYLVDPVHALRAADARDWWPHRLMVDAALVDAIHGAGGRVIVWTVNDAEEARALAALGVDGICTDVPDLLRTVLR
jgi:glycerophosphoryl diester phosphodiesterase